MYKSKTFLCAVILFSLSALMSFGQNTGEIKFPNGFADVKNVVREYDGGTCKSITYDIGGGFYKIKFISDLDGTNYIIEIIKNKVNTTSNDNYASVNNQYCISKSDYDKLFSKNPPSNKRVAYGMLGVPFKIRFNPTTVAPGGELGGFFGWYLPNSNWLFAIHGGLSAVSLNDIDSETPEDKYGFTGGIALIKDIGEKFQLGIVSGVDLFNGVDDWAYGYTPWLSLQIGFKFTEMQK